MGLYLLPAPYAQQSFGRAQIRGGQHCSLTPVLKWSLQEKQDDK
jgi:hypothetical protein